MYVLNFLYSNNTAIKSNSQRRIFSSLFFFIDCSYEFDMMKKRWKDGRKKVKKGYFGQFTLAWNPGVFWFLYTDFCWLRMPL